MPGGEEVVSLELTVTREKEVARLLKRLRPGWRRADIILWQVLCSTAGAVQYCRYFAVFKVHCGTASTLQYCMNCKVLQLLCNTACLCLQVLCSAAGTVQQSRYCTISHAL